MGTPSSRAVAAVLFDAAGTLIATRETVGATYARLARPQGIDLPAWRLEDAFRRVLRRSPVLVFPGQTSARTVQLERDWWRRSVQSTFLAADSTVRFRDFDALFDALFAHFGRTEAWEARAGAQAVLRALRQRGLGTAVVSNFDHRLPGILEGLHLLEWLDIVVRPADAGAAKPDPRIFELALQRLGVAPDAALFVGDDAQQDLDGARAAGLRAIDVTTLATLADVPDRIDADFPEESAP